MTFDPTTAKPVFDPSTAKPVDNTNQGLDIGQVANAARNSLMSPSSSDIGFSGIDPISRAAQGALGNIYSQGKNELIGKLPSQMTDNPVKKALTGLGFDALAGTVAGAAEPSVEEGVSNVLRSNIPVQIGKTISKPITAIGESITNSTKGELPFIQKVRQAFTETKQKASDDFGNAIQSLTAKYPDRPVDLSDTVNQLKQDLQDNPQLRTVINRIPQLKNLVESPESDMIGNHIPKTLNLQESQDLKNAITSKIPQGIIRGQNVRPDDLPLLDINHNINEAQLNAFPDNEIPELAQAKKQYGQIQNDYRMIKGKIKQGSLSGNLQNKFGGDPEVNAAVNRLIGNSDIYESIPGYRIAKNMLKAAPAVGAGLVGVPFLDYLAHRALARGIENASK